MHYERMVKGTFLARPNRFVAHIEIDGQIEVCHVKNTGRCRELLPVGAQVWCQKSTNPGRKTKYDLIAVQKGKRPQKRLSSLCYAEKHSCLLAGREHALKNEKPLDRRFQKGSDPSFRCG